MSSPPAGEGIPKRERTQTRSVEMSAEEQKKLEDIRRKLKDIFVTAEKAPPKEETIKPAEQQTVTSGLLDLRDLARDLLSKAPEQQPAKVDWKRPNAGRPIR